MSTRLALSAVSWIGHLQLVPRSRPMSLPEVSILNEEKSWKPAITVKQILLGIQDLVSLINILAHCIHPC